MLFRHHYQPRRRRGLGAWGIAARAIAVAVVAAQVPTGLIIVSSLTVAVLAVMFALSTNPSRKSRKDYLW